MTDIGNINFTIDCEACYLWQYDKAPHLLSVLNANQSFYATNVTNFWNWWHDYVFNIDTAERFGLEIYGMIFGVKKDYRLNGISYSGCASSNSFGGIYRGTVVFSDSSVFIAGNVSDSSTGAEQYHFVDSFNISSIACSDSTIIAIDKSNNMLGYGNSICFGLLDAVDSWDKFTLIDTRKWVNVSMGSIFDFPTVVAIDADGNLYTWGSNNHGATGLGKWSGFTNEKTNVVVGTKFSSCSTCSYATAATDKNGNLYVTGYRTGRIFGIGSIYESYSNFIQASTNKTQISMGDNYALAINNNGTIMAIGDNSKGQLGDGTTTSRMGTWVSVYIGGKKAKKVFASYGASFAIDEDDHLWGWGWNSGNFEGIIGNGTTSNILTPVKIGNKKYKTISIGYGFRTAVTIDGEALSAGSNDFWQLGDGTKTRQTTEVRVLYNNLNISISDDFYRRIIKGEMLKLNLNGSLDSLNKYLSVVFPDHGIGITNMNDGTMTARYQIVSGGYLSDEEKAVIETDGFLPLPAGVGVSGGTVVTSDYFGFCTTNGLVGGVYYGDYSGFNNITGGTQTGGTFYK